ncbi:hypothetical protein HMI55_005826 [Coelomomyces lativittatus]|nr:hypothetical protein HMI55_005826 [Coelomomyces lativittatus]KAJ1515848.1 hypothetical protein HMI56_000018 [Coelomomyces lativittatus]
MNCHLHLITHKNDVIVKFKVLDCRENECNKPLFAFFAIPEAEKGIKSRFGKSKAKYASAIPISSKSINAMSYLNFEMQINCVDQRAHMSKIPKDNYFEWTSPFKIFPTTKTTSM